MLKKIFFIFIFSFAGTAIINQTAAAADTLTQRDTNVVVPADTLKDTTSVNDENEYETTADDFANRLKSQLNLTEDQTAEINSIIYSFIMSYNAGETVTSEYNDRIEKLLNDSQKAGWNLVRERFWSDLKERLNE